MSAELAGETAVRGEVFTAMNQRFAIDEEGDLQGPRGLLEAERDAALEASVASLQLSADASSFPHVALEAFAFDAEGEVVEGLAGSAFQVREGDSQVTAHLLDNRVRAPRVLVVEEDSLCFETAPRFVMTRRFPRFREGLEQRVDILPLTRFASAAESPAERLRATMATSLQLALLEEARYDRSTLSLLDADAALSLTDEVAGASVFEGSLEPERRQAWDALIDDALYPFDVAVVPSSAQPLVLFGVHPQSGSVVAYLPDGSGGGATFTPSPGLGGTDRFFDMMGAGGALGSPALGFWIALQKAIARQLVIAITAIRNLEGVDGSEAAAAEDAARDFACDLAKGAVGASTGSLGSLLGRVDGFSAPFGGGIPCE